MNNYKEHSVTSRTSNKIALFCNARDERNIKEWAAHHLLIGFDIIIIFDHKSKVPLSKIFENFDKRVIIVRIELESSIKIHLMNKATIIAKLLNVDWFIYLDADEFLILNDKFKGVKHFLSMYNFADSLGVNWLMFGSNNLVDEPNGLILENYSKSSLILDQHVKSFVRPNEVINCTNPHFYKIKNPRKMISTTFNIINYPPCFNKINLPYYRVSAYIAHYVYQSEETYLKRKINLNGDDGSVRQSLGKEIHNLYNDFENLQPQKYIKKIKEFLDYYK